MMISPGRLLATVTAALAVASSGASAGNSLSPGKFELYPTLENLSVYLQYRGDDNKNSKAAIHYRKAGAEEWREAHPPVRIDERKLGGRNWTGSILFLGEGTAYEVRMTVSDPDGVGGEDESRIFSGTVTTRRRPNPSRGQVIAVAPGESIQAAVDRAKPGTVVLVKKGVHYEMVRSSKSGTAEAPITIRGEPGAKIFGSDRKLAAGEGWKDEGDGIWSAQIRAVRSRIVGHDKLGRLFHFGDLGQLRSGRYRSAKTAGKDIAVEGAGWTQRGGTLHVKLPAEIDPRKGGLHVSVRDCCIEFTGARHVTVEGLELAYAGEGFGICLKFSSCSNTWAHHNYVHHGRKRHIAYLRFPGDDNLVEYNYVSDFPVAEWPWRTAKGHDCEDSAISFRSGRGNVARYNVCDNFFNGIDPASFGEGPHYSRDCDIYGNWIVNTGDDCLEPDGYGVNQRMYHNYMVDTKTMAFSIATVDTGPAYLVRNVISNYGRYILKAHNNTRGHVFYYHNSSYVNPKKVADTGRLRVLNTDPKTGSGGIHGRNNVNWATAYMIRRGGRDYGPSSWDYDCYFNPLGTYRFLWLSKRAESLSAFQALGQEKHGFVADPQYVDADRGDLMPKAGSPLVNKGVVIKGINDDLPDGRPDLGAFELGVSRWDRDPRFPAAPTKEAVLGVDPSAKPAAKPTEKKPDPAVTASPAEAEEKKVDPKAAQLFRAARQAERSGMKEMAKVLYERLVKEYPDSPLAEEAKKKLE